MFRLLSILLLLLVGCSNARGTEPPSPLTRIDHVILGIADLEAGMAEIERLTGVRPVVGGSHPGRGTRNALMSLGEGTYLELLAPDPAQTIIAEDMRGLVAAEKLTPVGWAVSGPDEAAVRSLFTSRNVPLSPAVTGSRRRPDGVVLKWVTFGYASLEHPLAPFFIVWADASFHPSRTSPGGCQLAGIELVDPSPNALRQAIGPLALPVTVAAGPGSAMKLDLRCRGRSVKIG